MLRGIADGSVDVIATDHAPHHYDEKKMDSISRLRHRRARNLRVALLRPSHPHGMITLPRLIELCPPTPRGFLAFRRARLPMDSVRTSPCWRQTCQSASIPRDSNPRAQQPPFAGWQLRAASPQRSSAAHVYVNEAAVGADRFS